MKYFSIFRVEIQACNYEKDVLFGKDWIFEKKKMDFRIFMHTCDIFSDGIGHRFSSFSINGDSKGKYSIGRLNTRSF